MRIVRLKKKRQTPQSLLVCLGYDLKKDGSMNLILKNRLDDCIRLVKSNFSATILLMGGYPYHERRDNSPSQSKVMKEYLEKHLKGSRHFLKIITEEKTTSTVEQLCWLKNFLNKKKSSDFQKITIVSSRHFQNRVKLYAKYIFGDSSRFSFISSKLPLKTITRFKEIEKRKLKEARNWLKNHKVGDDESILKEQKEFQQKVFKGKMKYERT